VAPALGSLLAAAPPAAAAGQAAAVHSNGHHTSMAPAATATAAAAGAVATAGLGALWTEQAGLATAAALAPAPLAELKLTVLVTWGPQGADVFAHVSALPPRPRQPLKVLVRGGVGVFGGGEGSPPAASGAAHLHPCLPVYAEAPGGSAMPHCRPIWDFWQVQSPALRTTRSPR
jgi:hypothetical protein